MKGLRMQTGDAFAHLSPCNGDRRLLAQGEQHLVGPRQTRDVLHQLDRVACILSRHEGTAKWCCLQSSGATRKSLFGIQQSPEARTVYKHPPFDWIKAMAEAPA